MVLKSSLQPRCREFQKRLNRKGSEMSSSCARISESLMNEVKEDVDDIEGSPGRKYDVLAAG